MQNESQKTFIFIAEPKPILSKDSARRMQCKMKVKKLNEQKYKVTQVSDLDKLQFAASPPSPLPDRGGGTSYFYFLSSLLIFS